MKKKNQIGILYVRYEKELEFFFIVIYSLIYRLYYSFRVEELKFKILKNIQI